ncbi:MAG: ferrous iron transport protein A [Clostridiales bacterium]|jgi:ferrous iron transport protein A|nr:ferrous iron transport protein A [Clostridiales bacterium]MDR2751689.1 ferrous iron transport protein A [Clostridiales bacterium]
MPLTFAEPGEATVVKKVGGKAETRQFLENLGFVEGSFVTVVSKIAGNLIVNVKGSRIAISRTMADKIVV